MGRVDDVVNVAGHRLGTAEIESALVAHRASPRPPWWGARRSQGSGARGLRDAEAGPRSAPPTLKAELLEHVAKEIGKFARPDDIRFTDTLPKTRSGKIMRRLLKEVASGKVATGDMTTLEDLSVLAKLQKDDE
jgi:acetyl-CoA synthetase